MTLDTEASHAAQRSGDLLGKTLGDREAALGRFGGLMASVGESKLNVVSGRFRVSKASVLALRDEEP
jgi:hypothetical protein